MELRLQGKPADSQLSAGWFDASVPWQRGCQALFSKFCYENSAFHFLNVTMYYDIECAF